MIDATSEALASSWLQLWNGNLDLLATIVAEDVLVHQAAPDEARTGERRGREALGDQIRRTHEMFEEATVYELSPIAQPPYIVVRWRSRGTYRGGMPGIDPAAVGASIDFAGIDILRVEGGKVAEFWMSADFDVLTAQLKPMADR